MAAYGWVDLGTQSFRVTLLDEDGAVMSTGSAKLWSAWSGKVRHEQDPKEWWEASGLAVREATAASSAAGIVRRALPGEFYSRLLLIHGDTRADPPAFAVFTTATVVVLVRIAGGGV